LIAGKTDWILKRRLEMKHDAYIWLCTKEKKIVEKTRREKHTQQKQTIHLGNIYTFST